jgi:type IV secretory pathway VirB2 component (pilin)
MLVTIWRLVTIMLAALSMGTALCHLLEMPAKITYEGALWLTLLQTLYRPAFGTFGAFFEIGAVVTVLALTFLVRRRRPGFV